VRLVFRPAGGREAVDSACLTGTVDKAPPPLHIGCGTRPSMRIRRGRRRAAKAAVDIHPGAEATATSRLKPVAPRVRR